MKPVTAKLPRYHSRDLMVMVLCMVPVAVLLNNMLYGSRLFQNAGVFSGTLVSTFIFLTIFFNSCGFVAVHLRNRFPSEGELVKRILICLGVFYLMSALFITLLLFLYDRVSLFGYQYKEIHFYYAYLSAIVVNTFITFLMEAIYRFEQLKEATNQTERLRKECMNSKLLGLKSQVNPHFLFNSLNTLSSLIHEDGDKAELFLNHMSKVYRYLLRYRDEPLVPLQTELGFINSYFFLLKQRHNEGIKLRIDIDPGQQEMLISPLTLQVIIENTVGGNVMHKDKPLSIHIRTEDNKLIIHNSVDCKPNSTDNNEPLQNVIQKYELLAKTPIRIYENCDERVISIPLIENKTVITS